MKFLNNIVTNYRQYTDSINGYISKTFSDLTHKYNNSTVIGQLVGVIKASVENIMLYLEDAFVEQNKFTAIRKKSIYSLAQQSGYRPSLGKAAGAQIKISYIPTEIKNPKIIIENHTEMLCKQNGMVYQLVLPQDAIIMSIAKDNSSKYLYAVEGTFEEQTFTVEGGKLFSQYVQFDGDVDDDYISVYVNNEKWEQVESLYDMDPAGKQWTYQVSIMGGIVLYFGNDVHGRALINGDVVRISYLKHSGEYGNLVSDKLAEFVFINPLHDTTGNEVDGNSIFRVCAASVDHITSGTFSETQDQVKRMIGYNSRSLVLAGPEHYKSFINRFSFCGFNRTWAETGSLVVNSLIMRNYKTQLKSGKDYFNLTEGDFVLTPTQKESVINCIKNSGRQLAGTTYNIFDPELCKYALYVYVKLKNESYNKTYIEEKVRQLIGTFFSNIQNDDYIPTSDIATLLTDNVSEIDGINCYFLSEANETAIITGQYVDKKWTFNPSTGTYVVKKETVKLYDGEDPGLGLDAHGNIILDKNEQYPVLMGGWQYLNSKNNKEIIDVVDPLTIVFE